MSFHREFAKLVSRHTKEIAVRPYWYQSTQEYSPFYVWWMDNVYTLYRRYWADPCDKYYHSKALQKLRYHGMLADDICSDADPYMERAYEILPYDLKVERYRRAQRSGDLFFKKLHVPVEEQNYDPMIPYMAPYIEEAKFQMQEEQELLRFHPYDNRWYRGGVSGFGETEPGSTLFTGW